MNIAFLQCTNGEWVGDRNDPIVARKPDGDYVYASETGPLTITIKATRVVRVRQGHVDLEMATPHDPKRDFHVVRTQGHGLPLHEIPRHA